MATRCHVLGNRPGPVEEKKFQGILDAARLALYLDHGRVLVNPDNKD